jgi:hypothetical protein
LAAVDYSGANGATPTACPTNSGTGGVSGSTAVTACMAAADYYGANGATPTACPTNSGTGGVTGSSSLSNCAADAGYTGSGSSVEACVQGKYKAHHASDEPCDECPCNSLTLRGASVAQTKCHCGLGHTRSLLGVQAAGSCPVGFTDPLGGESESSHAVSTHFLNITRRLRAVPTRQRIGLCDEATLGRTAGPAFLETRCRGRTKKAVHSAKRVRLTGQR